MRRGIVGVAVAGLALALGAAVPEATPAKGLPTGADPGEGVTSTNGASRYVALEAGDGTIVARISPDTGEVLKNRYLSDPLQVPGVALDRSATGLAADGETLVLSRPFVPGQPTTELAVLDARRLRVLDRVALRGSFTVDAISPDGERLYLIEYLSPRDLTEYRVRAYDVDGGRLLPQPIVDPREPGEEMYGLPLTRAMSPDGRWAYTLYTGPKESFIHALDTRRGAARCIDVEGLSERDLFQSDLRASPNGTELELARRGEPLATVDTRSFEVTYASASSGSAGEPGDDGGGGPAWILIGAGAIALAAAVGLMRRRTAHAA